MGEPTTIITGAGRSACPQEGAGNLSERFLAKNARHAQWHKQHSTVSGEKRPPRVVAKNSSPRVVAELLNKEYANDGN